MRAQPSSEATSVGNCSVRYNANLWQNRHNRTMKQSLTVAGLVVLLLLPLLAAHQFWRKWRSAGQGSIAVTTASISAAPVSSQSTSASPPKMSEDLKRLPAVDTSLTTARESRLIAQAAHEVARFSSLDAKLRLTTNLLGQELVGSGSYYQLARDQETLLKMELKLQVANQVSSLLQVSDGRFLWVRRDLPERKSLSRIDQRRVSEALAKQKRSAFVRIGTPSLALGGLTKLLEGLDANFQFEPPVADKQGESPVWLLSGAWKPERLADLWPEAASTQLAGQAIDMSRLPPHLPERVLVVLSRDGALPLFPYRVEYQRSGRGGEPEPLVLLELFDVRTNIALDPRLFAYKPGDQEVADETEAYINAMRTP